MSDIFQIKYKIQIKTLHPQPSNFPITKINIQQSEHKCQTY